MRKTGGSISRSVWTKMITKPCNHVSNWHSSMPAFHSASVELATFATNITLWSCWARSALSWQELQSGFTHDTNVMACQQSSPDKLIKWHSLKSCVFNPCFSVLVLLHVVDISKLQHTWFKWLNMFGTSVLDEMYRSPKVNLALN